MAEAEADTRPIYYICAASKWQVGNLGPLAALGWERVKGIALCVGWSGDTVTDEREANGPARYLSQWVRGNAPASVTLTPLEGDGNSFRDWYEKIKAWAEPLAAIDPIFLINTTGGMKPITFGAALGLDEICSSAGRGETELIYYQSRPQPRIELLKGLLSDLSAANLAMSDYLRLRGWVIHNPDERRRREMDAEGRRRLTAFLWAEFAADASGAKSTFLKALVKLSAGASATKGRSVRLLKTAEVEQVINRIFSKNPRIKAAVRVFAINLAAQQPYSGAIAIRQNDRSYFAGGWLEEYIFNRVRDAVGPKAQATTEVALGVKIRRTVIDGPQHNNYDHEIDVTVYHHNLLHIISCKSGIDVSKGDKLEVVALKTELGGAFGLAALVAPREKAAPDTRRQLAEVGADYLTGPSGIEELLSKLAAL